MSGGNHEQGQWPGQQMSAGKNCKNAYNLTIPDSYTTHGQDWERADSYSSGLLNRVNTVSASPFPLHTVNAINKTLVQWLSQPTTQHRDSFHLEPACFLYRYQWDELGGPSPLTSHNLIPKSLPWFFHQKPNPRFSKSTVSWTPKVLQEQNVLTELLDAKPQHSNI